jgi:predicted ArsR family transcriptional regulator
VETETIDKLFLELSQFTRAKTEKDIVSEVFAEGIRLLYEEVGVPIPDQFCPEKEIPRLVNLLRGYRECPYCQDAADHGDDPFSDPSHA